MKSFCNLAGLALSIIFAFCISAEDLILPSGKTYTDYKITRTEADGITIMHSDGVTKLSFSQLPGNLQQQYNYDPQKAQNYNRKVWVQRETFWAQREAAAKRTEADDEIEALRKEAVDILKKSGFEMIGEVSQVTENGVLIYYASRPYRWKEEIVTPGFTPMKSRRRYVIRTRYIPIANNYEPVFVVGGGGPGFTDGTATDGAAWSAVVYPAGTYSYTTVMGAVKTVKCFAVSAEAAYDYILQEVWRDKGKYILQKVWRDESKRKSGIGGGGFGGGR